MSFFNIPSELVKKSDEEVQGFVGLKSAIYKAKILCAYIVDSSRSEARALTIQYQVEGSERTYYESLWYQGGAGLNTYNDKKSGEAKLLPSFTQMLNFFAAASVDIDAVAPKELLVKHYGTEGKYSVFVEFTGKVMDLGIRHKLQDDYQDETEVDDTQEVAIYLNDEGKTGSEVRGAKNGYSKAAWEKMIKSKPTLDQRKKSKAGAVASTGGSSSAAPAVKSW